MRYRHSFVIVLKFREVRKIIPIRLGLTVNLLILSNANFPKQQKHHTSTITVPYKLPKPSKRKKKQKRYLRKQLKILQIMRSMPLRIEISKLRLHAIARQLDRLLRCTRNPSFDHIRLQLQKIVVPATNASNETNARRKQPPVTSALLTS